MFQSRYRKQNAYINATIGHGYSRRQRSIDMAQVTPNIHIGGTTIRHLKDKILRLELDTSEMFAVLITTIGSQHEGP